jgi:hypothetical protein
MSGYYMTIHETSVSALEGRDQHLKRYMVRYSMPGLGFNCEAEVDNDMAGLLKVAIEHGKKLAQAEIRAALGVKE